MDPMALAANRHSLIRDYAFTAMGTALMVLVAVLVMHVPIVNNHPSMMMAQSVATPALKASPSMNASDLINDAISTLVIVPDGATPQGRRRNLRSSPTSSKHASETLSRAAPPRYRRVGIDEGRCVPGGRSLQPG